MSTFRNMAGYMDRTAGEAIKKADRERTKKGKREYMKKRNCRRTMDEKYIHEKAVKMRKMTDEQLVYYVEDRVQKAKSEGVREGEQKAFIRKQQNHDKDLINIDGMIEEIGKIKGIGLVKMQAIKKILEKGLVMEG